MITYSLQESNIFYIDFSETVTLKDIENYLLEFEKLTNLPDNLLTLYNMQRADMELSAEDIAVISDLTEKVTAKYNSVKTAFLVDKPNLQAYTFLFSVDHNLENTMRLVFSSEKKAINWLKE